MAKKWNAEDTALIQKEIRNPTMSNQQLAVKLGRSLQSIAAKKRSVTEQLAAAEKKAAGVQNSTAPNQKLKSDNTPWTAEEDKKLMETPYKSEDVLAQLLHRTKKAVHIRREELQKKRLAGKAPKTVGTPVSETGRVPLEQCTKVLTFTDKPASEQDAEPESPAVTEEESSELLEAEMPSEADAAVIVTERSLAEHKFQLLKSMLDLLKANSEAMAIKAVHDYTEVVSYILEGQ